MTGFTLKIIAASFMLLDHIGAVFSFAFNSGLLRALGRAAFPLYVFLLAEGCRHTRDIKKYMLRLFLLAIISELPYDLLFYNIKNYPSLMIQWVDWGKQNVFFTLFLGVLSVYWYNFFSETGPGFLNKTLGITGVLLIISLGGLLRADYASLGVAVIFLCYLVKERNRQLLVLAVFILWSYGWKLSWQSNIMLAGAFLSVLCVIFYTGKEGYKLQGFFYSFYPLHILLLFTAYQIVIRIV